MDPLSIATTAAGIASACFKVTTAIYTFAGDARNVDWKVGDLLQEVQGISRVSEAISSTWSKNSLLVAAQTNNDSELWSCVKESLDDTKRTLAKLDDKLEELKPQSFLARGFLRRPAKALKLNLSLKEINTFKQQLQSHQSGMQSSLLMINVCLLLSSNSSSDSINQVLGGLKTQIGRVEEALQGQHHVEDAEDAEDNARIAHGLRSLVRAAESIHSSASTVVGDSRSTVWGGSMMGDPLNEEDYGYIQQWIPPPILEEDEQSNHSESKPDSEITSSTQNESDQDSDDSDIERHLTKRYRELAFKAVEQKDYPRAESFYRKVIDRNEQDEFPPAEMRKMKIMLAYICSMQNKWDETEEILVPIAMAKGTPEVMAYHGLHALSVVRLQKGELDLAIKYCKRAAGGHKKFGGKTSPSYHRSMALLAHLSDSKGDPTAAEGYRSFLPPGFVWQLEKDPRGYMENIVIETVSGLRGTPSLSNIASINVRALTPTPGVRQISNVEQTKLEMDQVTGLGFASQGLSPRTPKIGGLRISSSPEATEDAMEELGSRQEPASQEPSSILSDNISPTLEIPIHPSRPMNVYEDFEANESPFYVGPKTWSAEQDDFQGSDSLGRMITNRESPFPALNYYYCELDAAEATCKSTASSREIILSLSELIRADAECITDPAYNWLLYQIPRSRFLDSGDNPSSINSTPKAYSRMPWVGQQQKAWRVVVAIDLNSSLASVAFAAGVEDTIQPIMLTDQTSADTKRIGVPTVSYYNLSGELIGWGDDEIQMENFGELKGFPICYFQADISMIFKRLLMRHDTDGLLEAQSNVFASMSRIGILADYLAKFRTLIHDNLTSIISEPFKKMAEYHDVEYAFTVPHGATESGRLALTKAAEIAGLLKHGRKSPITTVDLAESAFIDSVYSGSFVNLGISDVLLNIDVGIETVDIRALEVTSDKGTLSLCTNPLQSFFGTRDIMEFFKEMLDAKVAMMNLETGSESAAKLQKSCIHDFRSRIQHSFTNNGQRWASDTGIWFDDPGIGIEEGYMTYTNQEILSCFEPFLRGLRELVRRQLHALMNEERQPHCILLKGFNENHHITQCLKKILPSNHRGIIVCVPSNETSFVRGSVIARLMRNSNEGDPEMGDDYLGLAKFTYLITSPLDFDASRHLESVRVHDVDGVNRCHDSAKVFLRHGSLVTLGEILRLSIKRPMILGGDLTIQDDIYTFNTRMETGVVISMSTHFGQTPPPVTKVAALTSHLTTHHPENYFQKYPRKQGGWYYIFEYQIFISIRMSNDSVPTPELYIQSAFMGDELITVGELTIPVDTYRNVVFGKNLEAWKNYDQNTQGNRLAKLLSP